MESAQATIRYATYSKVLDIRERVDRKYVSGAGPEAIFDAVHKGYYALFEGSFEAIHLGYERPALSVGDTVKIIFEKVPTCQPSPTTNQPNS